MKVYEVRDHNDEGGHAIWSVDEDTGEEDFFCVIASPYAGQEIADALTMIEKIKELVHGEDADGIVLDIAKLVGEDIIE